MDTKESFYITPRTAMGCEYSTFKPHGFNTPLNFPQIRPDPIRAMQEEELPMRERRKQRLFSVELRENTNVGEVKDPS